jgi:hypothetical protein
MGGTRLRWLKNLTLGVALTCMILVLLIGISVALMPVSLLTRNLNLAPAVVAVYGSARAGKAELAGGYQLSWTSGLRAWGPHLSTQFVLVGSDTRITGQLRTGLLGIAAQEVSGRAGPGLAALVPGAWRCDMTAVVSDLSFGWNWRRATAAGTVNTPAGTCTKDGRQISIPPLALALATAQRDALATLTGANAAPLATVRVGRDRVLGIAIQPAAADVFPQLPRGGPINLQLPF